MKTLSAESRQGLREFLTEIETISDIRHPNLVELIGYCLDGTNRILVYEYLENKSLDRALFGKFAWNQRSTSPSMNGVLKMVLALQVLVQVISN